MKGRQAGSDIRMKLEGMADEFVDRFKKQAEKPVRYREMKFRITEKKCLKIIEEFAEQMMKEEGDKKAQGVRLTHLECAIAASAFRDARSIAQSSGLTTVLNLLFYNEHHYRRLMYARGITFSALWRLPSRDRRLGWRDRRLGWLYGLWGLVSRYGTSVGRWFAAGAVTVLAFGVWYMVLVCLGYGPKGITDHGMGFLGAEAFTTSLAAFTTVVTVDLGGANPNPWPWIATLLFQVLCGLAYFGFGFSILVLSSSKESVATYTPRQASQEGGQVPPSQS